MLNNLEIDGRELLPLKEAATAVSYTRDYVTRLAREGKIFATVVGRQWYVDLATLQSYVENIKLEQQIRKKQLSEQRKQELEFRDIFNRKQAVVAKKSKSFHSKAMLEAVAVLMLGLVCGWVAYFFSTYSPQYKILAQVSEATDASKVSPTKSQSFQVSDTNAVQNEMGVTELDVDNSQNNIHIESMGDVSRGVMLFPAGVSSSTVKDLFSDVIRIKQRPDGVSEIELVGKDNVSKTIPFVAVPVTNQ